MGGRVVRQERATTWHVIRIANAGLEVDGFENATPIAVSGKSRGMVHIFIPDNGRGDTKPDPDPDQ